jgi:CheY-like chemotaxis protein
MFLPLVPPPETLHVQDLGDAPRGNGETVLLVEDDEQVLLLTRALVQDLGYRVLAAMDGVEALELEAEHEGPIELLLTDVIMPAMGGFELAQIMGGGRPELGIVYMSGYPQRGQVETVTPPADAVFVQKPFRTPELAQALQQALSTRAAFERGEAA